jgi:hypothetical protein
MVLAGRQANTNKSDIAEVHSGNCAPEADTATINIDDDLGDTANVIEITLAPATRGDAGRQDTPTIETVSCNQLDEDPRRKVLRAKQTAGNLDRLVEVHRLVEVARGRPVTVDTQDGGSTIDTQPVCHLMPRRNPCESATPVSGLASWSTSPSRWCTS